MRRLITALLVLSLTGCAGFDIKPYWDQFVTWSENYNKPPVTPLPPTDPVKPPDDPVKPPDPPVPGHEESITVADLDLIPGRMRVAGFEGSDNALWYALAYVAAFGPGSMPDDGAGSLIELSRRSLEIEVWWNKEIDKVIASMRVNSLATAIAIAHDGRDRCGFRLGPAIMDRLKEFGDRVKPGVWVPDSEY